MSSDYFRVRITENAKDDLRRIGKRYGKTTYQVLRDLITDLAFEPEKKGEPLCGALHGLFSKHYSRFRVIYHIDKREFVVLVIGCGFHQSGNRADVYAVIERLLESGVFNLNDELARPDKPPGSGPQQRRS